MNLRYKISIMSSTSNNRIQSSKMRSIMRRTKLNLSMKILKTITGKYNKTISIKALKSQTLSTTNIISHNNQAISLRIKSRPSRRRSTKRPKQKSSISLLQMMP